MSQISEEYSFIERKFDRLIIPTDPEPFETNEKNFNLLSSSRFEQKKSVVSNLKEKKIRPTLDEYDLSLSHEVLTKLDEKENNVRLGD